MKKILIITRDFPPYVGRGNVMRILKFAKYLPVFGWQPFIISEYKDKTEDASLLDELPAEVKIKYVSADTPQKRKNRYKQILNSKKHLPLRTKLRYILYRSIGYNLYSLYQNYFMAPDLGLFWAEEAFKEAERLHGEYSFDAVLSTGPPFSTFLTGYKLNEKYGIPLVLDFRDGWVGNPIFKQVRKFILNCKNKLLERKIITSANLLVFATEPIHEIYRNRFLQKETKMITINNGFDSDDFNKLKKRTVHAGKLKLIYSGTISGKQEPSTFFRGLLKAINSEIDIKNFIEVTFLGKFNFNQFNLFNRVKDYVNILGILPHQQALEKMSEADAFLLIINPVCGKTMMTGKIFEYIAFEKPILAVSISCAATDLIKDLNIGYIADYNNENQIKDKIIDMYFDWRSGLFNNKNYESDINKFERKKLTHLLSVNLDSIVAI